MTSRWDPEQYERFKAERSRPFFDLLAMVRPRLAMRVVDLGCGTGELTSDLHAKLGARETVGIDSSETMLAKAEPFARDGLRFVRGRIEDWEPDEPRDLIFSNAAFHWVDGQEALFGRLSRALAPGGQIAVQVPANDDHPSHAAAAEVAREPPFREALGGFVRTSSNLALEAYAARSARLRRDERPDAGLSAQARVARGRSRVGERDHLDGLREADERGHLRGVPRALPRGILREGGGCAAVLL